MSLHQVTAYRARCNDANSYFDHSETSSTDFPSDDWTTMVCDDDDSSFSGSSMCCFPEEEDAIEMSSLNNDDAKVRFGNVSVREYAVTVGAPASRMDHDIECPIELDWKHTLDVSMSLLTFELYLQHRKRVGASQYGCIRYLDVEERRERIAEVQGITREEVIDIEMQHVFDQLKQLVIKKTDKEMTNYVSTVTNSEFDKKIPSESILAVSKQELSVAISDKSTTPESIIVQSKSIRTDAIITAAAKQDKCIVVPTKSIEKTIESSGNVVTFRNKICSSPKSCNKILCPAA